MGFIRLISYQYTSPTSPNQPGIDSKTNRYVKDKAGDDEYRSTTDGDRISHYPHGARRSNRVGQEVYGVGFGKLDSGPIEPSSGEERIFISIIDQLLKGEENEKKKKGCETRETSSDGV